MDADPIASTGALCSQPWREATEEKALVLADLTPTAASPHSGDGNRMTVADEKCSSVSSLKPVSVAMGVNAYGGC